MVSDGAPEPAGSVATQVAAELPRLYRYARAITANQAEAEDLVGDTVERALERAAQFRGEATVRTWLHQILHHLAVDRARHHAHELSVEDVETRWRDETYSVDPSVVVERAESIGELRDALIHLPQLYRSAVVLHDAEGWPSNEVARVLGISVAASKQRIRRGRMMLVSALAQGGQRRTANAGVPLSCWDARQQVSSYIDGELEPATRAALEAHLAGCATCPPLYRSLVATTTSLGALRDPDSVIPPALAERVREHLDLVDPPEGAPSTQRNRRFDDASSAPRDASPSSTGSSQHPAAAASERATTP